MTKKISIKEESFLNSRISLSIIVISIPRKSGFQSSLSRGRGGRASVATDDPLCCGAAREVSRYHSLVTQDLSFYEITPSNVNPFCATSLPGVS